MEASPTGVIQYFNGEKQNLIPLFQRPYTWEEKNWATLWEDLMTQYDLGVQSHNKEARIDIKNIRCFLIGVEYSFKGWDTPNGAEF
jgi:uncharacterized protein with ParB-like and HNH nuclease domain